MKYTTDQAQECIREECNEILELLLAKNRSYGNSFSSVINIFSKLSAGEQILVRIDDKLSRIVYGTDEMNEDTVLDLIGYLILWRVLKRLERIELPEETY